MGVFCSGLCYGNLFAQISPSFTQFFMNPYRINASYAGIEGRPVIYLAHRQQWVGIEDAPVTTTFSMHAPLNLGLNLGADFYHDSRGILKTNSFLFTVGYSIAFSQKDFLRFGLSGGLGFRNIDLSQVDNPSDPALLNAMENNLFINGNFGVSYHTGYFSIGVAIPNLFEPNLNNTSTFENGEMAPFNEVVFNTSYRFYFGLDDYAFEPHILYRYSNVLPQQYEVAGIFHLKNIIWLGGSFRQDYGVSALGGVKINNQMAFGYSYGLGIQSFPGIGKSSHEFSFSIQLGQKSRSRRKTQNLYLSFIDTERVYWETEPRLKKVKEEKPEEIIAEKPVEVIAPPQETISPHDNPRLALERELAINIVSDIRTETLSAGDHPLELPRANYIIVKEDDNQNVISDYVDKLSDDGERAGYGYVSRRKKWMVFVYQSDSKIGLRKQAAKKQNNPEFKDAWILTID
ncbi:MAG: type IX secretion system membrane protein PorP/SprF [Cyclobacteriaceae bacterium]|nr:type IX secretion system membrane protein PorP/SprF [Cyclobacteriaceae bacterium]